MAKLYTDEVLAIISKAEKESLIDEASEDVIRTELEKAFNRGVRLMAMAIRAAFADHDFKETNRVYEELVEHDQR